MSIERDLISIVGIQTPCVQKALKKTAVSFEDTQQLLIDSYLGLEDWKGCPNFTRHQWQGHEYLINGPKTGTYLSINFKHLTFPAVFNIHRFCLFLNLYLQALW